MEIKLAESHFKNHLKIFNSLADARNSQKHCYQKEHLRNKLKVIP
jgi:hypothetical protein